MQAAAATGSRLYRGGVGAIPDTAGPTSGVFNLEWSPRAGNVSGDTRAGKSAR